MVAQVFVETEKPGTVMVRAVASADKQDDARPVAGFFVRRRYHGDTFMLADWKEFSPRWMQFMGDVPTEWLDSIKAKFGEFPDHEDDEPQVQAPQMFSMGQAAKPQTATINYSNGKVKRSKVT